MNSNSTPPEPYGMHQPYSTIPCIGATLDVILFIILWIAAGLQNLLQRGVILHSETFNESNQQVKSMGVSEKINAGLIRHGTCQNRNRSRFAVYDGNTKTIKQANLQYHSFRYPSHKGFMN